MTLSRRRMLAWILLGGFVAFGLVWLGRLDFRQKISTDVLDLLPVGERDPELGLVRELAGEAEARTMLLVVTDAAGGDVSMDIAREFAARLRRSPHFAGAIPLNDSEWRDAFGRELVALRFTLLLPNWLREQRDAFGPGAGSAAGFAPWLADRSAAELDAFLQSPQGLAFQDLVPADPLLLVPRAVERMGQMVAADAAPGGPAGLVWAQAAASPLSEAGQAPVFATIEEIASSIGGAGRVQVAYTGVNRFAHASRARIQREVAWLNVASLAAVLAVAAIFIRRLHRGLHLVPIVLVSMLAGWVVTTAAFERVHIVVLVLGSLLSGVAIDYGFHLYAQPPAAPEEGYGAKLRRLIKPLLASCLTTAIGFALLLAAELPLLRQLGVFVVAGLLAAAAGAVLYFGAVRQPYLATRAVGRPWLPAAPVRRRAAYVLLGAALMALVGLSRVTWRDDVRELEIPAPELRREDARIRALFGQARGRAVWLTSGRTLAEAREMLQTLETHPDLPRGSLANLGPLIPTAASYEEARHFVRTNPSFPSLLRAALERRGFDAGGFEPFFAEWRAFAENPGGSDLETAVARLHGAMAGPIRLMLHRTDRMHWFVSMVKGPETSVPPPGTSTIALARVQLLNELFARYRQSALRLSLGGVAVIAMGVMLVYGVRDGLRIFAIPGGACLGIFGLLGWLGQPLTLFHLLGAFLAMCLTYDYAIFTLGARERAGPPASVRLSALTTAASFGVLAMSAIPAVHALGATVALVVVAALVALEITPPGRSPQRG